MFGSTVGVMVNSEMVKRQRGESVEYDSGAIPGNGGVLRPAARLRTRPPHQLLVLRTNRLPSRK